MKSWENHVNQKLEDAETLPYEDKPSIEINQYFILNLFHHIELDQTRGVDQMCSKLFYFLIDLNELRIELILRVEEFITLDIIKFYFNKFGQMFLPPNYMLLAPLIKKYLNTKEKFKESINECLLLIILYDTEYFDANKDYIDLEIALKVVEFNNRLIANLPNEFKTDSVVLKAIK